MDGRVLAHRVDDARTGRRLDSDGGEELQVEFDVVADDGVGGGEDLAQEVDVLGDRGAPGNVGRPDAVHARRPVPRLGMSGLVAAFEDDFAVTRHDADLQDLVGIGVDARGLGIEDDGR